MIALAALPERFAVRDAMQRFMGRGILRGRTPAGQLIFRRVTDREIARLTGMPRTTLQRFLADPTVSRVRTVERIASLLDDPRLQFAQPGKNVLFVDAPRFTPDTLRNLRIPEGATRVRFISEGLASPGREYGSTGWLDIETDLGQQAINATSATDNITRVLFFAGN